MISEKKWKSALTNIIEELDTSQYKKMLQHLDKIPKSQKTSRNKEQMAQTIIEHYGVEKSISEMKRIMSEIPRNDSKIQNILRPFVDKLQEERAGKKRKRGADAKSKKKQELKTDDIQANKEIKIPAWRKPIKQLKTSKAEDGKAIAGKVVKKSGLRTYKTQQKEKKVFFHLGLADETDIIKVMVYGRKRFKYFEEGKSYSFRKIMLELLNNQDIMKVTKLTQVRRMIKQLVVPKNLERKAQNLIS